MSHEIPINEQYVQSMHANSEDSAQEAPVRCEALAMRLARVERDLVLVANALMSAHRRLSALESEVFLIEDIRTASPRLINRINDYLMEGVRDASLMEKAQEIVERSPDGDTSAGSSEGSAG